ncbi:MAG TPA: TlpA disulfide reductase family protein [Mycobacteriales bacterium]|nr:TlpA disulfide reductase family protein [Mycobacteriales bacterium]
MSRVALSRSARFAPIAVLAIAVLAGCAGTGNVNTSVTGSLGYQFGPGNITVYKSQGRAMVGNVNGTTLQGRPLSLASYRGDYVVVNFWQSECSPCRSEEPALEALSKEYASKGVRFVGIDWGDNRSSGLSFERQFGVTYPSLIDRADSLVLGFPGGAPSTPTTIVIDPHGGIAARINGPSDYTHIKRLLNDLLSESA